MTEQAEKSLERIADALEVLALNKAIGYVENLNETEGKEAMRKGVMKNHVHYVRNHVDMEHYKTLKSYRDRQEIT